MEDFSEDYKALEDLLIDIEIFDQIEEKLSKFNPFEILGIVNTEIRHSNVLSWLLNPKENHGIGDLFIKKFIQTLFYQNKGKLRQDNIDLLNVSLMDYYDFTVRREWKNIDILAVSDENKLLLVIENKLWSYESEHQLEKYLNVVNDEWPGYKKIFVFLTPSGETPSDEENWISFNYKEVFEILEKVISIKKDAINENVKLFIQQYLEVLRRYIVGDTELERICREIYYKHPRAIDLICTYKPDIYLDVHNYIVEILESFPNIVMDNSNKTYTRFITKAIDDLVEKKGKGWTASNRILLYEFQNRGEKVELKLIIGPGDDDIRKRLFNIVCNNKELFKRGVKNITPQFTQIFAKEILPKNFIENNDKEVIKEKLKKEITKFVNNELNKIDEWISSNYI